MQIAPTGRSWMCTDHQGVAQNMAVLSDTALSADGSGVLLTLKDPNESGTVAGWGSR